MDFVTLGAGRLRHPIAAALIGAASGLAALPACGVELSERIDLHGYGHQTFMQSSANTYMGADRSGTWNNNYLGLVLTGTLTEKSKLWAQVQGSSSRGDRQNPRVSWLFVDYQLNDAVRVHAGRVKLPLGLYTEYIDAKALHLAALEPSLYQSYRTGGDMEHDAYHGVGIDIEHEFGGGHLRWQAWGGRPFDVDPPEESRDRRAWGGRVTWQPPIDGLKLMLSGYRTQVEHLDHAFRSNEDRAIASVELARGPWELRAERSWHREIEPEGATFSHAWYVQGGYTFAARWTPYLRYDSVTTDRARRADPSHYQRTVAIGLGYKLGENLGLRLENHFHRGYALPVATGEVEAGAGRVNWQQFVAAINFRF